MSNNFSTNYYNEKTKLTYESSFLYRDIQTLTMNDYVTYRSRIGLNGNLTANTGATYSYSNNNNVILTRLTPKCDIGFNYRFLYRMSFKSNFHIDKDLTYDIVSSRFDNLLSFNGKYTTFSLGYNYNKIIAGKNSDASSREGHMLQAKFVRKF
jgi:hypothetical protein